MKFLELKVCGLKYHENISELVNVMPQRMGFIFFPGSKRFVLPDLRPEHLIDIPSTILKTGVFVNQTNHEVMETSLRYKLDLIQLHGNELPEQCAELNKTIPVIKAFGIGLKTDWDLIYSYENSCYQFLFDTFSESFGGSGLRFPLQELKKYKGSTLYFISGGIGSENLYEVIDEIILLNDPRLVGLEVNSAVETSAAVKNIAPINLILNKLRNESKLS